MSDTEGESASSLLFDVAAKEESVPPNSTPDDVNNLVPEPALSQEDSILSPQRNSTRIKRAILLSKPYVIKPRKETAHTFGKKAY